MKFLKSIIILLFCPLITIGQCDSLHIESKLREDTFKSLTDYHEKIDYLQASIDHFIKCEYFEEALDWKRNLIYLANKNNKFREHYSYLLSFDSMICEYEDKFSPEFKFKIKEKLLIYWSDLNFKSGQHTKAIAHLQSIENLIENELDTISDNSAQLIIETYKKLWNHYYSKKEYQTSLAYLDKAMKVCSEIKDTEVRLYLETMMLGLYSLVYLNNDDQVSAKQVCYEHLRKAKKLYNLDKWYKGHLYTANSRLAEWHIENNSIDSALFFNNQYNQLVIQFKDSQYFSKIQRAEIHIENEDYTIASEILRSLLADEGGIKQMIKIRSIQSCLNMIDLFFKSKEFEIAKSFQDSISLFLNEKLTNPLRKELPIFNTDERYRLELIVSKLNFPENYLNIDSVLQISKNAFALIGKGFESINTKQDKLFFSTISSSLTQKLLKNLDLDHPQINEFAFSAIEQSKATTLSNSWKQKQQIKLSENADIFFREEELLSDLERISKKILTEKDSSKMLTLKADIKLDEIKLDSIKLELSKSHPAYYAMKYNWTHSTIEGIQAILHTDEVLVNYFEGDSFLYAITISSQNSDIVQIDSLSYIYALIDEYSEILADTKQNHDKKKKADRNSYLLYQQLIMPLSDHLKDRIIISPSEQLNQIPFSSLRMNTNSNYEVNDLMVANHAISYVPSASIFSQQRLFKNDNVINAALVVAPSFNSDNKPQDLLAMRSSLGPLIFNVQEAEMVSKFTKNELLISEHATKEAFLNALTEQDLIHFSTHAKSNEDAPDKSYLAFYDEGDSNDEYANLLYLDDLSKLYMPAKMVVLSACETGLGKLYKGEGAMSLANACFYAGAQSVVSTLWSVQDKTTFDIISSFYEYLDQGLSKDVALQKAQLDFLASHSETFNDPYYWAGYTVIGNNESLVFVNNSFIKKNGVFILICSSVVLFIFLYFRKKKWLNAAA